MPLVYTKEVHLRYMLHNDFQPIEKKKQEKIYKYLLQVIKLLPEQCVPYTIIILKVANSLSIDIVFADEKKYLILNTLCGHLNLTLVGIK